jgi:hypothetical protein
MIIYTTAHAVPIYIKPNREHREFIYDAVTSITGAPFTKVFRS